MIVDTSAIAAVFFQEEGYEHILHKVTAAQEAGIGTPTLVECGIVLTARLGRDARGMLGRFLEETNIITIPFTDAHTSAAIRGWMKYGKGRHSASLNFGDCLTYAVAKVANMPLLYTGEDFRLTDLSEA
jgi:ribonuclease VapC